MQSTLRQRLLAKERWFSFRSSIVKLSPSALVCKLTLIMWNLSKVFSAAVSNRSGTTSSKLEL